MIAGIALIWSALQSLAMVQQEVPFATDSVTLTFGLWAAVALTASNLLLLECLARMPVSIASTIYRLNTVPLVILAVLLLGESLNILRGAGIAMGIITVGLLHYDARKHPQILLRSTFWIALIVSASCMRAIYGILTKSGLNSGASADTMILLAAICWLIGGSGYFIFVEKNLGLRSLSLTPVLVAGCLVFLIVWLLTEALSRGDASLVIPITNMGFVAAFMFSLLFRLEQLTFKKTLAILCAVVSVLLLGLDLSQ